MTAYIFTLTHLWYPWIPAYAGMTKLRDITH